MIKRKVRINLLADVKDFVNTACALDCDIDLVKGRYVIDAKSIMGIFSMDFSKPLDLIIHSDNQAYAEKFNKWIVE